MDCELSAGDVMTVFLSVINSSFALGNALPELESFAITIGSAAAVFEIIDRVTKLDKIIYNAHSLSLVCYYRNRRLTGVLTMEKLLIV